MLINLTPHTVTVSTGGALLRLPPTGAPARVVEAACCAPHVTTHAGVGLPVTHLRATRLVTALPDPRDGDYLIVSRAVAAALPNRADLLVPGGLLLVGGSAACRGLVSLARGACPSAA